VQLIKMFLGGVKCCSERWVPFEKFQEQG